MSKFTYTAADELDRRAANRALKRTVTGAEYLALRQPEPDSAEGRRLAKLGTEALIAEARGKAPAAPARKAQARKAQAPARKAPAAKPARPERTAEQKLHTQLREQAWQALVAERALAKAEGRKARFTYAEACAAFGTAPAKAAK